MWGHPSTALKLKQPSLPAGSIARETFLSPDATKGLALATCTVLAFGAVEGAALTAAVASLGSKSAFAARYSVAQLLPSIIWATRCPKLVAEKLGMSPSKILCPKPITASRSRADLMYTYRSIVAGFVGISQILRAIDIGDEANKTFRNNVMQGREPMFESGVKERVVRLAAKNQMSPRSIWHGARSTQFLCLSSQQLSQAS